eukprot:3119727-Pyramimonas_sp.AAC.1
MVRMCLVAAPTSAPRRGGAARRSDSCASPLVLRGLLLALLGGPRLARALARPFFCLVRAAGPKPRRP